MKLETERLMIRDLEQQDKERLFSIIWQEGVVRYMRDWSENVPEAQALTGFIDWHRTQKDSTDVFENKRYAVILKETGRFIGIVGMGLEDTVNEVEMAYFIDEAYRGNGYAAEALQALFDWCMRVSDLPYLILTIDEQNLPSCRVAEKAGFILFEKRTPIGHKQPNMVSPNYYYYRKYRS